MRSNTFPIQLVRLMGRKEARSLADFPCLRIGTMRADLHACGEMPVANDRLNIASSSESALDPRALRKDGGISSGPAAPLRFILAIAFLSSASVKSEQLGSPTVGDSRIFFNRRFSSRSSFVNWSLLTAA